MLLTPFAVPDILVVLLCLGILRWETFVSSECAEAAFVLAAFLRGSVPLLVVQSGTLVRWWLVEQME